MTTKRLLLTLCLALFAIEANGLKKFVAYKQKTTFFPAWQTCRLYGGHLASIESAAENAQVEAAIKAVGSLDFPWTIGGTDIGIEGRFVWFATGKEITNTAYKNWYTNEPNDDLPGEDCIAIGSFAGSKWNDIPCTYVTHGFVCAFVP
uniref:C-type lectin domain-containing protein n=1 Tax=Anopheles farauti TaxID=69004 RepID=A0A182QNP7_9DIPT